MCISINNFKRVVPKKKKIVNWYQRVTYSRIPEANNCLQLVLVPKLLCNTWVHRIQILSSVVTLNRKHGKKAVYICVRVWCIPCEYENVQVARLTYKTDGERSLWTIIMSKEISSGMRARPSPSTKSGPRLTLTASHRCRRPRVRRVTHTQQ